MMKMISRWPVRSVVAWALMWALSVPAGAQLPPSTALLNPVQSAWLQAEHRKVEESFVQKVMGITGASREQVMRAIPARGRITDRLSRIYSALERDLGAPLSDEQKGLIYAAEGDRKQARKDAESAAASR
ncbi:MAG TPA: hypothetical protein PLN96_11955 [Zoogloea sp.]|nr:hypothetical protein [Rhodocyclaceae bacterium]HNI48574.1 hypothetical protein [Zoogloea sp.]HMW51903.1 hypothetical protein [Rhodocyclaceae bacterium]HMY49769.1 hypothetical protein [Rhodocyclaceae bacterium]HNA66843.1 hypothetical protein [Rhodocyclaceae bacterium]